MKRGGKKSRHVSFVFKLWAQPFFSCFTVTPWVQCLRPEPERWGNPGSRLGPFFYLAHRGELLFILLEGSGGRSAWSSCPWCNKGETPGLLPCVQLFAVSWLLLKKKTKQKTWVLETMNAYRYMLYIPFGCLHVTMFSCCGACCCVFPIPLWWLVPSSMFLALSMCSVVCSLLQPASTPSSRSALTLVFVGPSTFASDEHPPGMRPPLCSPLKPSTQTLANVIYLGFCARFRIRFGGWIDS